MTRIAAILTLTLAAATARGEPLSAFELFPLPPVKGAVTLSAEPFERSITVHSPDGTPAIARALRALSRSLCPEVAEFSGRTVLTCRSTRVVGRLVPRGALVALEVRELQGLPATGDAAIPLLFHDPASLGLGACPGANHAARGECQLRDGRQDLALGSFLTASRSPIPAERAHALLRLGDLALGSGDVDAARERWAGIDGEPWRRMADARRCELSVECLARKGDAVFEREGMPASVARELTLRSARARAFRGEVLAAAWALADQFAGPGACGGEVPVCRRIVLSALRSAGERDSSEALAIFAAAVRPGRGPLQLELASAAAAVAEREGAPAFAAALLSGASSAVADAAVAEHLLRTAELYVRAGDAVRARVVVDFLRSRRDTAAVVGPRWARLQRDVAALRARKPKPSPPAPETPELVAAARSLDRARAARARISQSESGR
ncbi:MAG TPA: hypothetical protein VFK85_08875 [Anaeromyxobacteraceae bacterium]|nr:hypothetical protein [Anaeromyxobacteraceae bacterium]